MITRIAGIFVIALLACAFLAIGVGLYGEQQCKSAGYHTFTLGFPYPWKVKCGKYTPDGIVYVPLEAK